MSPSSLGVLIASLALVGLAIGLAGCVQQGNASVAVGEPLPPFELPRIQSGEGSPETLHSSDLANDGPVILNFWATWCRPCVREIPVLKDLHAAGVRVVSISIDSAEDAEVLDFAREHGIEYDILRGSVSTVVAYGSSSIPYTLVLDEKMIVRSLHRTAVSASTLERDLGSLD